jgi:sigma-B regulation protein RsbU (phosphoserine phosphatase)
VSEDLFSDTAEDLFENAPVGYLATDPDGTIRQVNRTFETLTGLAREDLVGRARFRDLLAPGARIYHETHYAPLLRMQGAVREIAVEIVCADGTRLPALINSTLVSDADGAPRVVRTTVLDASDRRRYEQELLRSRNREADIAQQLQRSLLSGELPQAPGLDLDVAYRPAVAGLEVGGDWYDAFWVEPGTTIGLVVGDVVGRGIEAAATMGQLRSAVRALASTGLPPGALLGALDGFASRHAVGRMATLVCAQLSLETMELRFACAGHPPPVIAPPGETPHLAWEGRSVPLDCFAADGQRAEGACRLDPGSALLLYTDGLIERRRSSLSEGLDRLVDLVAEHRAAPAAELSDAVLRGLHDPEHADDVCLVTVRVDHVA